MSLIVGGNAVASRVTPWDANHVLAYSLNNAPGTTTISNEGSGGTADLTVADGYYAPTGTRGIRMGVPGPAGPAMQYADYGYTSFFGVSGAASYVFPSGAMSLELIAQFHDNGNTIGTNQVLFEKLNIIKLMLESNTATLSISIGNTAGTAYDRTTKYLLTPLFEWMHILAVFDGATTNVAGAGQIGLRLYLNGMQFRFNQSSVTTGAPVTTNANKIVIGCDQASGPRARYALQRVALSNIARPESYATAVTQKLFGY